MVVDIQLVHQPRMMVPGGFPLGLDNILTFRAAGGIRADGVNINHGETHILQDPAAAASVRQELDSMKETLTTNTNEIN